MGKATDFRYNTGETKVVTFATAQKMAVAANAKLPASLLARPAVASLTSSVKML